MVKMVKTVEEVTRVLKEMRVADSRQDFEGAHVMEDDLYEGVLRAIAALPDDTLSRSSSAKQLAKAALRSKRLHFSRSCA